MNQELQTLLATTVDLINEYEQKDGDSEKIRQMRRFMEDIELFSDEVIENICTAISERCAELLGQLRDTEIPEK